MFVLHFTAAYLAAGLSAWTYHKAPLFSGIGACLAAANLAAAVLR